MEQVVITVPQANIFINLHVPILVLMVNMVMILNILVWIVIVTVKLVMVHTLKIAVVAIQPTVHFSFIKCVGPSVLVDSMPTLPQ